MEQALEHLFITSNSSHFFNKTNLVEKEQRAKSEFPKIIAIRVECILRFLCFLTQSVRLFYINHIVESFNFNAALTIF